MTTYFQSTTGTKLGTDNRVFLYEVVIRPQSAELNKISGSNYRRGKVYLKVPYSQMTQTMQQIARQQGKILSVTLLTNDRGNLSSPSPQLISPPQQGLELSLPWWVEIWTAQPHCLYYFGPFNSAEEAKFYQGGYLEDLQAEGATGISIQIKQCQPHTLTQEFSN